MNINPTNDSSYIDFGMSFGSNIWGFITYPPPNYNGVVDEAKMGQYLNALFSQMKNAGQKEIYLAFGQLDNIDSYNSGNFGSAGDTNYDVITQLLSQLQKNNISVPGYKNLLDYIVDVAHQNGMKVSIAFGGGIATDSTFKILQQSGETYQGEATKLAEFMKAYNIDGVDFDIEDATALSSQKPDGSGGTVLDFFQTLHSQLEKEGRVSTLTTMLGSQWRATFSGLLGNFPQYFDGLNLMAYSDTQFWIDPNTPPGKGDQGWTIEEWIDAIGKGNASMIHVGFDDGVHYADPNANGGQYPYQIKPGSSDGQAAAQIYIQLLQQLKKDGYPTSLGNPFFWPASDVKPNGQDRYKPTPNNGSNFVSQEMQDFYNELRANKVKMRKI